MFHFVLGFHFSDYKTNPVGKEEGKLASASCIK